MICAAGLSPLLSGLRARAAHVTVVGDHPGVGKSPASAGCRWIGTEASRRGRSELLQKLQRLRQRRAWNPRRQSRA